MKIRAIRLENVRRFVDPVEIAGIGDGLNVLTAPNERGKSTFFDALYAVFFKDRKSWGQGDQVSCSLCGRRSGGGGGDRTSRGCVSD